MKKIIIISLVLITIIAILTVMIIKKYQTVEIAAQLDLAIAHHDVEKVKEIVFKHPDSVNYVPEIYPQWLATLTEQPETTYPLQGACWGGEYEIVEFLINNGADVNGAMKNGFGSRTPLMLAVLSESEEAKEIVELLLKHGADKSLKDSGGKTAYDYAVSTDNFEIAELLQP